MAKHSQFSASGSLIGYLYQVRLALLESLRRLRSGASFIVQIEALDDVTFEKKGEAPEILQSKHHMKRAADLTDSSPDLWKTLRIWSEGLAKNVLSTDSTFFLVTTAQAAPSSAAFYLSSQVHRDPEKAYERLNSVAGSSTNQDLKSAFAAYRQLAGKKRKALLGSIYIVDSAIDISGIDSALNAELFYAAEPKFLTQLATRFEAWWLRRVIKHLTASDSAGILSEEITAEATHLRTEFKDDNLPIDDELMQGWVDASGYVDKLFVHQLALIEIGNKRVLQAIKDYFRAFEQRSRWIREDLVLVGDIDRYEARLVEEWELRFEQCRDEVGHKASEDAKKAAAQNLYKWIETGGLIPIRKGVTEGCIARGSYHILSNSLKVGWHLDFLKRLKHLLEDPAQTA